MRNVLSALILWSILCLNGHAADAPKEKIVDLQPSSLPAPTATLTRQDVSSGRVYVYKNQIASHRLLKFTKNTPTHELAAAEGSVALTYSDRKLLIHVGDRKAELEREKYSFDTIHVPVGESALALAFPLARFYPNDMAYVWLRNGALMRGEIGGDDLCIYDSDFSNTYDVKTDCIRIDKGLVYAPLARQYSAGRDIYTVTRLKTDGSKIGIAEYKGKTGKLEIRQYEKDGLTYECAYLAEDGALSLVSADKKETYSVIPGTYKVAYGVVYAVKDRRPLVRAVVLPGPDHAGAAVAAGKEAELRIGRKLKLAFTVVRKGPSLIINPAAMHMVGDAGEKLVGFEYDGRPDIYILSDGKEQKIGSFAYG